jgi:hypothetical protein
MNIPADQISYKKQIGKIGSSAVWELGLRGGLHVVLKSTNGKAETLGAGPHRAVARFLAQQREPTLVITELSKADEVGYEHFRHLLPRAIQDTEALRAARGFED